LTNFWNIWGYFEITNMPLLFFLENLVEGDVYSEGGELLAAALRDRL
jgi:hypothetical protein